MKKHFEQIKLWASIICGIAVVSLFIGCASLSKSTLSESTITETEYGVIFETARPVKMTMKRGETEYTYDSQSESLMSKIMGILTLGVLAR